MSDSITKVFLVETIDSEEDLISKLDEEAKVRSLRYQTITEFDDARDDDYWRYG